MVRFESASAFMLDDTGAISVSELVEQSGLSEAEVRVLVDCGALAPRDMLAATWTFSSQCIVTARTARRLRDDFALDDAHVVAIVLRLRERIDALEHELRRLSSGHGIR